MKYLVKLAFAMRLVLYMGIAAGVFEVIVRLCAAGHAEGFAVDDGPLEAAQLCVILSSGLFLFGLSRGSRDRAPLLRLLGGFALFAAGRELDNFMRVHVGHHGYYLFTVPAACYVIYLLWRYRGVIFGQIDEFMRTGAFTFMFVGVLMVGVYAQIIGQEPLWMGVMGDNYLRHAKHMIEECAEMMGYLFIVFGVIEITVLEAASRARRARPGRPY